MPRARPSSSPRFALAEPRPGAGSERFNCGMDGNRSGTIAAIPDA